MLTDFKYDVRRLLGNLSKHTKSIIEKNIKSFLIPHFLTPIACDVKNDSCSVIQKVVVLVPPT